MNIPRLTAVASLYPSQYPYHIFLRSECSTLFFNECIGTASLKEVPCIVGCRAEGCPSTATPLNCYNSQCCACMNQCTAAFQAAWQNCQSQYGCPSGKACTSDVNVAYTTIEMCCTPGQVSCMGNCMWNNCPSGRWFDDRVCGCPCIPKSCPTPQVQDPASCGCVCPNQCTGLFVNDPVTCDCVCPDPLTNCNGICVDTSLSRNNCGTCDNHCLPNEDCSHSVCTGLDQDSNCGACDQVCAGGLSCCYPNKDPGMRPCVDLQTDLYNCGSCGVACTAGQCCEQGVCVPPETLQNCGHCG